MIGRDRRENSFIPALSLLFSIVALLAACDQPVARLNGARSSPARFNGAGNEVMLQGFHWTSYDPARNGNKRWYRIIEENAGVIRSAGFDYVWFPPPSRSAAGDNSYLPTQWYVLENGYGNADELKRAVAALRPARALCDIVINHRCGTATGGADFTDPSFGTAEENRASVVSNDDCNCGTGRGEENHRNGNPSESNDAGRDLDHTNARVQEKVREFLARLKTEVGFAGWRYDLVRGFNGYYVGLYNEASDPALSVGEYWDGDAQRVVDWIDETGGKSMAFDFPTRYALLAAVGGDYGRLKTPAGKPPGVIGLWPEMGVTFIENHDTEAVRHDGRESFPEDKVMQAYVYLLTHPGIPCVFWRHFFDRGDDQKGRLARLIAIRKRAQLTSRSTVFIEPQTNGKYAAIIDDKVAMKIGPASWSPGEGWEVALDGPDYAVWTRRGQ